MVKDKKFKKNRDNRSAFSKGIGGLSPDDPDGLPPVFSLEKMEDKHEYCINKCNDNVLSALLKKMLMFSRMAWKDIRHAPRHGLGSEIINRGAIRAPIPTNIPDDTNLLALRFSEKKAFVGYRVQRVFYILYIDKDFTLYNHG